MLTRNPFNQVFLAKAMLDFATASLCFRNDGGALAGAHTALPQASRLTILRSDPVQTTRAE